MLELVFVIVGAVVIFYVAILAMRIASFTLVTLFLAFRFLLTLLFLIFLVQVVVWIVFDSLLRTHFKEVSLSESQAITAIIYASFAALFLILVFGKSSAFKQYGTLAVVVNGSVAFSIISLLSASFGGGASNSSTANPSPIDAASVLSIYLTSVNLSTFLFYGYDKFRAWIFPKSKEQDGEFQPPPLNHWSQKVARWFETFAPWIKPPRVPEWILHWQSICGGSLGALFAQRFFHHKTKSKKFQPIYRKTVLAQTALLMAIFFLIKRS